MPFDKNSTETLEFIVDGEGLAEVMRMLAQICVGKAEHIRSSFNDEDLAKSWDRRSSRLIDISNYL